MKYSHFFKTNNSYFQKSGNNIHTYIFPENAILYKRGYKNPKLPYSVKNLTFLLCKRLPRLDKSKDPVSDLLHAASGYKALATIRVT